jgi:7-keto-8-aminopelargonate synthetase-like enzyme/predicted N-acyltransferase
MKHKNTQSNLVNIINEVIDKGRKNEILQLYTEDAFYDGRLIHIKGQELINFGSCSYLGLEIDERLKIAAIDAINRYGIQYSSSRSYVSCTLYAELESLIGKIFGCHPVLTPTTTLGHQAAIPIIIDKGDVIILDQQVHASVQYAAQHTQLKGITVSAIRHNNMEELEAAILAHSPTCNRIWYMADGIYSMYGDYIPLEQIMTLLNKYPKFHLYVDDAHGMSWTGLNGRGFVLGKMDLHPKMIVTTSFAKAFGTGGGVVLFHDKELCQKVRNCGGPMLFSGPNQIPVLAASIASAKIHLSDDIYIKQQGLKNKILYCHELMMKHNLPVVSNPETPIKFIGLGLPRIGYNMVKRMISEGFYCNLAVFPAVPETCTGLRFTITLHHTERDIENMVTALAYHFPKALEEENRSITDVQRAFKRVANLNYLRETKKLSAPANPKKDNYKIQHETTIKNIPEEIWDNLLDNGNFDWKWLLFLEQTFKNNEKDEYNWNFHYYIIWEDKKPLLATFFTSTLNKDDMLSQDMVSYQLELKRAKNPYYLCSKTFMMGSLLTEGQHLYVDRKRSDWKEVMMILLDRVWNDQLKEKANSLCLRDFSSEDPEIIDFLMDQGFIKISLPDNHVIENVTWETPENYLGLFNARNRWYLKDNVLKNESKFVIEIADDPSEKDIDKWYELYRNVKGKSFELNTFDLPRKLFAEMAKNKNCEIIQLRIKQNDGSTGEIVAVTFNIITAACNYCGVIIGLDYNYLKDYNVYKQALYQSIIKAGMSKTKKIFLGFTASDVKRKFGAKAKSQVAFVQLQDNYNMTVINSISNAGSS